MRASPPQRISPENVRAGESLRASDQNVVLVEYADHLGAQHSDIRRQRPERQRNHWQNKTPQVFDGTVEKRRETGCGKQLQAYGEDENEQNAEHETWNRKRSEAQQCDKTIKRAVLVRGGIHRKRNCQQQTDNL